MVNVEQVLAANGIRRPDITVRAAAQAGLDLPAACVVLMGETGGGQMIWGHDGQPSAKRTDQAGHVIYEFGGPVTEQNYRAFRAEQKADRIPRQGVGDCQLTSEEFVARAEQLGPGPWDPYCNQLSGFTGLANRIRQYGTRNGFRSYNGSGQAAEHYADTAMIRLKVWQSLLAGAEPGVQWVDIESGLPVLSEGDGTPPAPPVVVPDPPVLVVPEPASPPNEFPAPDVPPEDLEVPPDRAAPWQPTFMDRLLLLFEKILRALGLLK